METGEIKNVSLELVISDSEGRLQDLTYDINVQLLSYIYFAVLCLSTMILIQSYKENKKHLARNASSGTSPATWQNLFYLLVMTGSLIRFIFFFIQFWIKEGEISIPNQLNVTLNTLPTFIFISTYLLLLFFWAEMIEIGRTQLSGKLVSVQETRGIYMPIYYGVVFLLFFGASVMYLLDFTLYNLDYKIKGREATLNTQVEKIEWITIIVFEAIVSIGFLVYGVRLVRLILISERRTNHHSGYAFWNNLNQKQVFVKVTITSSVVTAVYLFRATVDIFVIFSQIAQTAWWVNISFFLILEVSPLMLILYVLPRGESST